MAPDVRRLGPEDAEVFRHLRLEGLRHHPEAFAESYDAEAKKPPHAWPELLERAAVFGAWREGRLVATATCFTGADFGLPTHMRHLAFLAGVYVTAKARGYGYAIAVCRAVIEHARGLPQIDVLKTAANVENRPALTLYENLGFEAWGRHPRALKIDGHWHDEIEMAMLFERGRAG
jgi:RimJ/RimL family protein N-acetyltransferase